MSKTVPSETIISGSTCNSSTTSSSSPPINRYILHLIPSRKSALETSLMNTRTHVSQTYGEDSTFCYPLHCSLTSFFDNAGENENILIDLFRQSVEKTLQVSTRKKFTSHQINGNTTIQETLFSIMEQQQPAVASPERSFSVKNSRIVDVSVSPFCPPESSHIVLPVDCPLARQVALSFAELSSKHNSNIAVRLKRASHMSLGHRQNINNNNNNLVHDSDNDQADECDEIKTAFGRALRAVVNSQYSFKGKHYCEENTLSWDLILLRQIKAPPSRFQPNVEIPGKSQKEFCVAPVCRVEGFATTYFVSPKLNLLSPCDAKHKAQAIFNHSIEIAPGQQQQSGHKRRKSSIFNCTTTTTVTAMTATTTANV